MRTLTLYPVTGLLLAAGLGCVAPDDGTFDDEGLADGYRALGWGEEGAASGEFDDTHRQDFYAFHAEKGTFYEVEIVDASPGLQLQFGVGAMMDGSFRYDTDAYSEPGANGLPVASGLYAEKTGKYDVNVSAIYPTNGRYRLRLSRCEGDCEVRLIEENQEFQRRFERQATAQAWAHFDAEELACSSYAAPYYYIPGANPDLATVTRAVAKRQLAEVEASDAYLQQPHTLTLGDLQDLGALSSEALAAELGASGMTLADLPGALGVSAGYEAGLLRYSYYGDEFRILVFHEPSSSEVRILGRGCDGE